MIRPYTCFMNLVLLDELLSLCAVKSTTQPDCSDNQSKNNEGDRKKKMLITKMIKK